MRIYRQRIIVLISISSLISIFLSAGSTSVRYDSLSTAFVRFFYFANDPYTFLALALTMLPFILLVYTLSGLFVQDLNINVIYCFSRKSNLRQWYLLCVIRLALMSFLCTFIYASVGSVILLLRWEYPFAQVVSALPHFFFTFVLAWLFVFSSSFLMNSFSFLIQPKYILPIFVTVVTALCAALPYSIQNNNDIFALLNPIAHFNYPLHYESFRIPNTEFFSSILPEMYVYQSIAYFGIIIAFGWIVGGVILKRTDIGLKLED